DGLGVVRRRLEDPDLDADRVAAEGQAPQDEERYAGPVRHADEGEQRQDGGEQDGDGDEGRADVASGRGPAEERADDARGAEHEQQRPDQVLADAGDVVEDGADERVGRHVPGDQQERGHDRGPDGGDAEQPEHAAEPDGVARRDARQQREQRGERQQAEPAEGEERDAPVGEPADQGSGRDAEDVRGGGAAERERGGAPDAGLGDDADGDSGGERPEPADADADDEPGDQQRDELGGEERHHVRRHHQRDQAEQDETTVQAADHHRDQQRAHSGDQAGDRDHQARGALGHAEVPSDGGEQAHGELFGRDNEERPGRDAQDGEPVPQRGAFGDGFGGGGCVDVTHGRVDSRDRAAGPAGQGGVSAAAEGGVGVFAGAWPRRVPVRAMAMPRSWSGVSAWL